MSKEYAVKDTGSGDGNAPEGTNQEPANQMTKSNSENQGFSLYQQEILNKAKDAIVELEEIKSTKVWRIIKFIWSIPLYLRTRRWLLKKISKRGHRTELLIDKVVIRALGKRNYSSKGSEVWLLKIDTIQGEYLAWDEFVFIDGFQHRIDERSPLGEVLFTVTQGELQIPQERQPVTITLLAHPWSGFTEIEYGLGKLQLDLFSEKAGDVVVDLSTGIVVGPRGKGHVISQNVRISRQDDQVTYGGFSSEELEWLSDVTVKEPAAITVLHPEWLGIRSSSTQLFTSHLWVGDDVSFSDAHHYARLICETGCKRIVFSGFALSHRHIILALRKLAPDIKIYVLWHGNFMQSREDYNWHAYQEIIHLVRRGDVYKVGFVKKGMAEAHAKLFDMRTSFVMNFKERIPDKPSVPLNGGPHLGIWSIWSDNWRKPPFAMLIASSLIPNAIIHGSHLGTRTKVFMDLLGLEGEFTGEALPQEEMEEALSKMHLNLYVTLSECAPMVPLESLSVGAPCLLGPTSHLFEDDEYLKSRLVVSPPDSSKVIADYIWKALEEREEIVAAYSRYAIDYNRRARQSVDDFLEVS